MNGEVILLYEGRKLEYTTLKRQRRNAQIIPLKQLDEIIDENRGGYRKTPSANHPWRRYAQTTGIIYHR